MRSFSLKTLAKCYGIQEGTHRSLSDSITLKFVYMKLTNDYCKMLNINFVDIYEDPEFVFNYHKYNSL